MHVPYSYLPEQFENPEPFFEDLRELVASGEFTLGPFVDKFEKKFAEYIGVKHAIGINTGTDALILALKAVGVKSGDEVITVANTFIATVGAIIDVGAIPVFVDSDDRLQIDVNKIEEKITSKTTAILPVHWAGCPCEIEKIMKIADRYNLKVVEDACPAAGAKVNGKSCGTFGHANAFSMHPLKPLNVWGDGGIIVTDDDEIATFLRLYHNHGLKDRDHIEFWGVNRRLQPTQAVVASRQLDVIEYDISSRIKNAKRLDLGLSKLSDFITVPPRDGKFREVYQIYIVRAKRRDELVDYLINKQIECKIHYPIPIHLQKAAIHLNYSVGDFPECEMQANDIITLPAHHYILDEQVDYMVDCISDFYK